MKIRKKIFSKILLSILLAVLILGGVSAPKKAEAITVEDITQIGQNVFGWVKEAGLWAASKAWDLEIALKKKVSIVTWHAVLNTALNKMAYETATWLGNGAKGQKPMFLTEKKGEYLKNMADNAAGQYIEAISKEAFGDTFNLCEPDINVKVLIGLGLAQPKLDSSKCTFTKMKDNWEKEVLENKEFLSDFNNYFETGGDLGIALSVNEKVIKEYQAAKEVATLDLLIDKGFRRNTEPISGKTIDPPGSVEEQLKDTSRSIRDRMLISTEDALVDASKVFANQYFLTLFQRKMSEIGSSKPKTTSPYNPQGVIDTLKGLVNSEDSSTGTNYETVSQNLNELLQPNFQISADFEVLTNLTTCSNPTSASPSECVIDGNFSSAISENFTIGQAMKNGYLRENGKFGFIVDFANGEYRCYDKEPSYTEGYPYRSMLILRKYRILPVGWELAAQYINDYPQNTHSCTLGDMVACFDANDEYTFSSGSCNQGNWCRGLVDPNWVLTVPQHLCKSSGPGPFISYYQNARGASDLDSNLVVKRSEYCADEQSCIYEKSDGNCEVYGYCVEEKRKWKFGTDSCDPNFNSCETYRDSAGKSVSYLENTVDNSVCTSENVGCTDYCEDYALDAASIPMFTIEQNGTTYNLPATFSTPQSAASFYNYTAASFNQPSMYPMISEDKSVIFVHFDTLNERFSVGMFHDYPNSLLYPGCNAGGVDTPTCLAYPDSVNCDCNGGTISVGINNISAGNQVSVVDDPGEGPVLGTELSSGYVWNSAWDMCCTDGGMIDMPNGNWTVTLNLNSSAGLNRWVVAYDGGEIPLDMASPVTISKNVVTGNFTCIGGTGNKVYLDKDAQACDKDKEGCHQFIRTKSGLGTNLIQNSSFEENIVSQTVTLTPGTSGNFAPDNWMVRNNSASANSTATVFGNTSERVHGGEKSLMIQADGTLPYLEDGVNGSGIYSYDYSQPGESQLPDAYKMELNKTYTLSAWVYVESGGVDLGIGNSATRWSKASSTQVGAWELLALSVINDASLNANEFFIYSNQPGTVFYVDDIQFEEGLYLTSYKDYSQANVVYEKILPNYLASSCYRNPGVDYRYRDDYSSVCDNFARLCNADEVGCDMYTSVNTDISVPAKVDIMDYCLAECVGYDQYMQHGTYFSSQLPKYFIPANAEECDAGSVGCEEFTNLDNVSAGGENKEYYSYLRQCVKPGEVGSNCGEFYTWEGSSETGFQLRVHSLQIDNDSDDASYPNPEAMYDDDPAVTEYDYDSCNEHIYKLNLNSDCREFYNRNGQISYHLYTDTITCSADCHDFRLTKNNVVKDPATGANISWPECQALSNFADYHDIITSSEFTARGGECVFCKNGGTWDSGSGSCLYKAIPAEGTLCSAEVNGCREYSGNTGSSIYNVSVSNFEGSTQDWEGIGATTVITDNDSLRVNEEALRVQVAPYTIAQTVGTLVQRDKSYYLEFIAKSITASQFNAIYLTNGTEIANFATDPSLSMTIGGQYALYKLNLASLNHSISDLEALVIQANGGFMIDDIKLVEITDRYYKIEDAWQTPDSCFQDIYANPVGPLYNLGCDEYKDRAGDTFYIHNFPTMCQESAVGCEALIDTHNYSDYRGITLHAGDASEEVIPADNIVYAVYDTTKSCFEAEKGCQILGKPYDYSNLTVYRPLYLVNDPDDYTNILCYQGEKNCKAWTSREGNVYFKDPGNQTCEYRLESDSSGKKVREWGWFKTSVKRCDSDANGAVSSGDNLCLESSDCSLTNTVCTADKDCGFNNVCISGFCRNACIDDKNDYPCPTTNNTTIGSGGEGGRIYTPTVDGNYNNWVGTCPSSAASCTEYLDPVSDFSVNQLANSNFASTAWVTYSTSWYCHNNTAVTCTTDAECTTGSADYCMNTVWRGSGTNYTQTVKLDRNYLYRLALINNDAGATLTINCPSLTEYDPASNEFGSVVTSLTVSNLTVGNVNSRSFYIPDGNGPMICTVQASGINVGGSDYAELKQIIIDYQLDAGLDKSSCNGIVNRDEGCVLFNERKVTSKNQANIVYSNLNYDADNTVFGASPLACGGSSCNANQVIKVTPDRACEKWLACTGTSEAGKSGESVCDGIGICDKLDKNGNCERFVAAISSNYVYNPAISGIYTAGDIYNMSGYVKVGYLGTMVNRDTTRKSDDKFNFGSMQPFGGQTEITNNSFESAEENRCAIDPPSEAACGNKDFPEDYDANIKASADWGDLDYPLYWTCDPAGSSKCEVIDDLIENENEKICFLSDRDSTCKLYAPDGRAYLKLIADNEGAALMNSDDIAAKGDTDYVMSFYVNTIRLSNGRARVRLFEYGEDGGELKVTQRVIEYRKDWRREVVRFRTNPATVSLKLELTSVDLPQGNVYFDKFDILEALQSRNGTSEVDTYETKDCRLYPKDDALSCDYYEGGIRYKGWTGYCLEYDRYPGWSNACLQWWSIPSSVDSVNAWCGDNRVGDEEDCDCAPDANGEVYSCPSQNNPSGTSVDNEYYCENCMWTQGWCGDNYIDRDVYNEQCDWNDSVNVSPVGSKPNTGVVSYGGTNYKITCENLPYAAVTLGGNLSTYAGKLFTDGNLGCFSSAAGKNYTANPLSADKCQLDTDYSIGSYVDPIASPPSDPVVDPNLAGFGCTTSLADIDYNDAYIPHAADQCIALNNNPIVAKAEVVSEDLGGIVVIDENGQTVRGESDFGKTFCHVVFNSAQNVTSLDDACGLAGSGWRNFNNWSATELCWAADNCGGLFNLIAGAIVGGMTVGQIEGALDNADCKTVQDGHDWSATALNYGSDSDDCFLDSCSVSCYGDVNEVGCY